MPKEMVITKEGLEKIKEELKQLKEKDRKEVIERIKSAKELGDLSENAEYDEAKNAQAFVEGRIQELEDMVKHAKVVEGAGGRKISMGSAITVECDGEKDEYKIVGPTESDPFSGKISYDSPIGRAMMDREIGEVVAVETPGGAMKCKILAVR